MITVTREFVELLAVDLAYLHTQDAINLHTAQPTARYVQLVQDVDYLQLETTCNFPHQPTNLGPADEAWLQAHGWQPPDLPGLPYWSQRHAWPLTAKTATTAATAFAEAAQRLLPVDEDAVVVRAWNLESDELLNLPSLKALTR